MTTRTLPRPRPVRRGRRLARGLGRLVPAALLLAAVAGCQERIRDGVSYGAERTPAVADPALDRDLDAIRSHGKLRILTHFNSTSYYIHKGGQAGFDYELARLYADRHDLALEVVTVSPDADLVSLLNAGQADVICARLVPDPALEKWLLATRPTNYVQKVVVLPAGSPRNEEIASLNGATITVATGGSSQRVLRDFRARNRLHFFVSTARPGAGPEELIAQVAAGEREALVVDDIVAKAAMVHVDSLKFGPAVGPRRPTVWFVRRNAPALLADLNAYLAENLSLREDGSIRRSRDYGIVYDRTFRNSRTNEPILGSTVEKSISPYDALIRRRAEAAGFDWRLVAALIFQESRFNPRACSSAGARGLMQVMPRFAGAQADSLYLPEANLTAGLRLLGATWQSYAYLDSLERLAFTLAEYHAGTGHVTDARRIAMEMGRDPNAWEGSLEIALPRLMEKRWYDKLRFGFYGGAETVDYVQDILSRYRAYQVHLPRHGEPVTPPDGFPAPIPAWPDSGQAIAALPGTDIPLDGD